MKKFALLLLLIAAPAMAGDMENTTVTFRNGDTYVFTPFDVKGNGMRAFHVTNNQARVTVDRFDGATVEPDTGDMGCFEIFYDATTDLLHCPEKNGYQGWYTSYYRSENHALVLEKVRRMDMDDPDTQENEEKTVTVYKRKK